MRRGRGRGGRAAAVVLLALMLPPTGISGATRPAASVTAVTWNLYLGADVTGAIEAESREELLAANAAMFRALHRTNFPERAEAIAARIVEADADVVALQEVALWLAGPMGDAAPATTVVFDFLEILQDELARRDAPYDAVVVQANTDTELPTGDPYRLDVRLVDRDAVLVKDDPALGVSSTSGTFQRQHRFPTVLDRWITLTRGWLAADLTVGGRPVRFVNTHLEAFDPSVRTAQAQELLSPAGPIGSAAGDVVLLGDLNTGPELPVPENREAFFALTAFGLVDSWAALHPGEPGFTAGFGELLDDPSASALRHRVDHVMTLGGLHAIGSRIVGADPRHRTRSGMWPSDHAGVVAAIEG